jgi:zinc transporter ZupT
MATETGRTDKGIGLGVLFSLLAGVGALGMYLGAPDQLAAWGFALAVLAGSLAVVAIHVYWD